MRSTAISFAVRVSPQLASEPAGERDFRNLYPTQVGKSRWLSQVNAKEPRVATILAPLDPVDRLAKQGSVLVRRRRHLCMVEKMEIAFMRDYNYNNTK